MAKAAVILLYFPLFHVHAVASCVGVCYLVVESWGQVECDVLGGVLDAAIDFVDSTEDEAEGFLGSKHKALQAIIIRGLKNRNWIGTRTAIV